MKTKYEARASVEREVFPELVLVGEILMYG
jgi:hypothetical protein